MKITISGALAFTLICAPVSAQAPSASLSAQASVAPLEATPQAPPVTPTTQTAITATLRPQATDSGAVLPANTEVELRLDQEVNSKTAKQGDPFNLSVDQDVMLGNYIVIPRGTPAKGVVAFRTGKGAFGKSAKMEIDLKEIDFNGRVIPIGGHYRQEGEGNTGATVGAAVAAGPFAAFVTGRSAIFAQGHDFQAFTKESIPVAIGQ